MPSQRTGFANLAHPAATLPPHRAAASTAAESTDPLALTSMGKSTSENPSEHIRRFFGDESHHASSGIIKNYSIGSWLGEI